MLIENRSIRGEEFLPADKLLRNSFDLLVKVLIVITLLNSRFTMASLVCKRKKS